MQIIFINNDNILIRDGCQALFDYNELSHQLERQYCYSVFDVNPMISVTNQQIQLSNTRWLSVRQYLLVINDEMVRLICRAKQILYFYTHHRFCGRCGHQTKKSQTELAMICNVCDWSIYPTLSTAIITLITRGREMLLARSPHFPSGIYSTLAGFVEAGETAEQTLRREVLEEVGIHVKNIRYFDTQSWPFPNSFMMGFLADYASGEIVVDGNEIEDAQWFTKDRLPKLPHKISISRALIDHVISQQD